MVVSTRVASFLSLPLSTSLPLSPWTLDSMYLSTAGQTPSIDLIFPHFCLQLHCPCAYRSLSLCLPYMAILKQLELVRSSSEPLSRQTAWLGSILAQLGSGAIWSRVSGSTSRHPRYSAALGTPESRHHHPNPGLPRVPRRFVPNGRNGPGL